MISFGVSGPAELNLAEVDGSGMNHVHLLRVQLAV